MPKLVAIGDSLTQGVRSGAVSRIDLSYPALIAEAMGLQVPLGFRVPTFPGPGLPLNIEWLLHSMKRQLGDSINWFEWPVEVPLLLRNRLNHVKDIYECDEGSRRNGYSGVYHNLAVSGFRVSDSFMVNDEYAACQIGEAEGNIEYDFFGLTSAPMYRIAQRVLNPSNTENRQTWTQIDNLLHLNEVENLILFLGANDCLGTVKDLRIEEMTCYIPPDPQERRNYNLTSVEVFESDYREMVRQISEAISPNTRVFVGTIPHVIIPPVTRGIGGEITNENKYFQHYVPFFMNDDDFDVGKDQHLTGEEAQCIDNRIDQFNCVIAQVIRNTPENGEWHIVDICSLLDALAVRRNRHSDDPGQPLRQLLGEGSNHPLLGLRPIPSVSLFNSSNSRRTGGGFFSLDCFHPTTIGYGLIAEAFLTRMAEVGVANVTPPASGEEGEESPDWNRLNWNRLIAQDRLIQRPPVLWDDVLEAAEAYPRFTGLIYRVLSS